jgi:hypothetical protein
MPEASTGPGSPPNEPSPKTAGDYGTDAPAFIPSLAAVSVERRIWPLSDISSRGILGRSRPELLPYGANTGIWESVSTGSSPPIASVGRSPEAPLPRESTSRVPRPVRSISFST